MILGSMVRHCQRGLNACSGMLLRNCAYHSAVFPLFVCFSFFLLFFGGHALLVFFFFFFFLKCNYI